MYPKQMIGIVKLFYNNNNYSIREVSKIFKISKSTIHRWIIGTNNKLISAKAKVDNNSKIIDIIKLEMNSNPNITINGLTNKINNIYKIKISKTGVYIFVKKEKFVFKKIKKVICKDKKDIQKQQKMFKKNIKKIKMTDIICIDETGICSNVCNNYGWSKKGKEVKCYIKPNPIKYSALVAIKNTGIICEKVIKGNINGEVYYNFLKDDLLKNIVGKYILCDNVSFHKSEKVKNLIKETKNFVLFIPPYSPELNPIENVFSIFKNKLKKRHIIDDQQIKDVLKEITQNYRKIYNHALR